MTLTGRSNMSSIMRAAISAASLVFVSTGVMGDESWKALSPRAAADKYVACIGNNVTAFRPYAASLDRLVFSSFFFCGQRRADLIKVLNRDGIQDSDKLVAQLDEVIVGRLVPKKAKAR